jgi:hypothetical protein
VIGGHTDMRRSALDHLQNCIEDANDGAEGQIRAFVEAAQAIEVAEQLVGAVYEMNDHALG